MNASEHLTRNQIAAFNAGSLAERESREIGRHLLGCMDCRGFLPLPNSTKFWTAVVSERDSQKSQVNGESPFSIRSYSHSFVEFFSKPRGLALSSGALVVILTLTLLLLTVPKDSGLDGEVAKSIENDPISDSPRNTVDEPRLPIVVKRNDNSISENRKPGFSEPKLHVPASESRKNKKAGNIPGRVAVAAAANKAVSQTRGHASHCSDAGLFEMEFGSIEKTLVLKWKEFPNAVKYHVYISDEDEMLIDEFETEKATSYTLTKPLDQKKSYRWKVIITLENGKTLNVAAQKFGAKDFNSMQRATKAKRRVETRCLISQ